MKKLTFIAIVLFAAACSKKADETKAQPEAAKVTANEPAKPAGPKLITTTTKSPEAKAALDRGIELVLYGRGYEAKSEFKKATELDPDFAQGHGWLGFVTPGPDGKALLDKSVTLATKLPEAERMWIEGMRQMAIDDTAASAAFTKVTELAPDDFRGFMQVGQLALNHGDDAGALKMFTKAQQMKPDLPAIYNGIAYANAGLGHWDAAIVAAKKQAELRPTEPNPHDTVADIQLMAGKLEEAEATFKQTITVDPKFAIAYSGLAITRAYRGDLKGAAEATTQRVANSPERMDKVDGVIDNALLLATAGKHAEAYKLLDGIDKDPENANLPGYVVSSLVRGMLLQTEGKFDDSAKAFAEAVNRSDKQPALNRVALRQQALMALRASMLLGKAAGDADKLVAVTAEQMTGPAEQSLHSWARGLASWAKTGPKEAIADLSGCAPILIACRFDLAAAQRKAGDAAGATATQKQIATTFVRDAGAVYFHAQAAKAK